MTIMEIKSAEKFNAVMKTVNPNYELTAIDPMDIGPDTILQLQKKISRGEIIVATGDRVSAHSKNRFITTKFLGKEANFPYGVFLMASLLECPIYYCFGLRDYPIMVRPVNSVYMEKSFVEFKNCGKKMREEKKQSSGKNMEGSLKNTACGSRISGTTFLISGTGRNSEQEIFYRGKRIQGGVLRC